MVAYNTASIERRDGYAAQLHVDGRVILDVLRWCFESLPDEVLVGMDPHPDRHHRPEVESMFRGRDEEVGLFAGQGYIVNEARIVNRGDSYSVHHLPEDWTDDIFAPDRGVRGTRFTHWLHTHPNAPAIPSGADADAAQETIGVDLILGVSFSPEGPLPWFDDVEGERRPFGEAPQAAPTRGRWFGRGSRPILGIAPTGHRIHGLELIAFHRRGLGVNVVLVDDEGWPHGWPFTS